MDAVEEWRAAYGRVTDLVSGLGADEAARHVPACPDWTVRDLLSHMIGLDADVVAGDEPDDHNSTWTQRQVDARAGRSIDELLEEWQSLVGPLTTWMQEHTTRPLGDLVIHEQDLRGALARPGARDNAGLLALRDRMLGRFEHRLGDAPRDRPARWVVGVVLVRTGVRSRGRRAGERVRSGTGADESSLGGPDPSLDRAR